MIPRGIPWLLVAVFMVLALLIIVDHKIEDARTQIAETMMRNVEIRKVTVDLKTPKKKATAVVMVAVKSR